MKLIRKAHAGLGFEKHLSASSGQMRPEVDEAMLIYAAQD